MKISNWGYCALSAVATGLILSGCNSGGAESALGPSAATSSVSQLSFSAQTASRMLALTTRTSLLKNVHPDHQRSWMSPDARQKKLLYVSDGGTNDVYVYSYHPKTLVGTLTGFSFPYGECSDKAGNVYVANWNTSQIFEYAHGGTSPINTLTVTGAPIGCSVDQATGNLAVSAFFGAQPSTGFGGIYIFQGAAGSPTLYTDPSFMYYWPPGYDSKGNLFVEGQNSNGYALDELPSGASAFTNITLDTTIGVAAGVQWDGKYVGVTDQGYLGQLQTAIYQVSVSGSVGTVEGTIQLGASPGSCTDVDVVQPWIEGGRNGLIKVVGGNLRCATVGKWKYPAGGAPTKTLIGPPFEEPYGLTVSR